MQQTYQTNDKHIKNDKNNMLYKQMQKSYRKCQQIYTIVKHVQKMQHTQQTNDKHIKKQQQTICCTNKCKNLTKHVKNIQTIVTHVQKCNKHSKQTTNTSKKDKNNMLYTQMQTTYKKCQKVYTQ